jgi:hypothetical protein
MEHPRNGLPQNIRDLRFIDTAPVQQPQRVFGEGKGVTLLFAGSTNDAFQLREVLLHLSKDLGRFLQPIIHDARLCLAGGDADLAFAKDALLQAQENGADKGETLETGEKAK